MTDNSSPAACQVIPRRIDLIRIDLQRADTSGPNLEPPRFAILSLRPQDDSRRLRVILQAEKHDHAALYGELEFEIEIAAGDTARDTQALLNDFIRGPLAFVAWAYAFPLLDIVLSQMGYPPIRQQVLFPHPDLWRAAAGNLE